MASPTPWTREAEIHGSPYDAATAPQVSLDIPNPEGTKSSPSTTSTSAETTAITLKTQLSMPDSPARLSARGRNHSKETTRARPIWTTYSTVHAKFTAPQDHQLIIPTENDGSSKRPSSQMPTARRGGCKAMTMTRRPDLQRQEVKRSSLRKSKR